MEVPLLWLAEEAITSSLFILTPITIATDLVASIEQFHSSN
jgi:hypothetical protein